MKILTDRYANLWVTTRLRTQELVNTKQGLVFGHNQTSASRYFQNQLCFQVCAVSSWREKGFLLYVIKWAIELARSEREIKMAKSSDNYFLVRSRNFPPFPLWQTFRGSPMHLCRCQAQIPAHKCWYLCLENGRKALQHSFRGYGNPVPGCEVSL